MKPQKAIEMQAKFIEGFNNMYSIDKNGTVLSYKMRSGAYSNKELVSMYKCRLSTLLNILNYKNWKNINSQ